MKRNISKLAVFDLDDTLYVGNSHFEILNRHFHTSFFTSLIYRAIGKFFPSIAMKLANVMYEKIPVPERKQFLLPCRSDVMSILRQKQEEGYIPVIVSNAPIELLQSAALYFRLDYYQAGAGEKGRIVQENLTYDTLFVCTDNKTDIDLIDLANEAVLTCKQRHKPFFRAHLKKDNYRFIDEKAV